MLGGMDLNWTGNSVGLVSFSYLIHPKPQKDSQSEGWLVAWLVGRTAEQMDRPTVGWSVSLSCQLVGWLVGRTGLVRWMGGWLDGLKVNQSVS